jgi:3-hydroxyisobutyrate dehydrogenase-like beta-hydroxyacid dehydrogenase
MCGPEAVQALLSAGANWVDSAAAAAGECEVLATCLPGPVEMEHVCLGPNGIAGHIRAVASISTTQQTPRN